MSSKALHEAGNKAIAEFMGGKIAYFNITNLPHYKNLPHGKTILIEDLKYHTSWDWLMGVWSKILSLNLAETEDGAIREPWGYIHPIRTAVSRCDIEATWLAIVEFINWYIKSRENVL